MKKISETLREMQIGTSLRFPLSDQNNVKGIATYLKNKGEGEWKTAMDFIHNEIQISRVK